MAFKTISYGLATESRNRQVLGLHHDLESSTASTMDNKPIGRLLDASPPPQRFSLILAGHHLADQPFNSLACFGLSGHNARPNGIAVKVPKVPTRWPIMKRMLTS